MTGTKTALKEKSIEENTLQVAYHLIQQMEERAGKYSLSIDESIHRLLSSTEPSGLPGLFLFSEALAARFNGWKEMPGARGRHYWNSRYRELADFMSKKEILDYASNRWDETLITGWNFCELRLTLPTALALEALLRAGLHQELRVVRAINTLMALRKLTMCGMDWCCGCMYQDSGLRIPENQAEVDYNREVVPPKEVIRLLMDQPRREHRLLAKHPYLRGHGTLLVIHRALSYHPDYAGSNLAMLASVEIALRQRPDGTWPERIQPVMLSLLPRLQTPLADITLKRAGKLAQPVSPSKPVFQYI